MKYSIRLLPEVFQDINEAKDWYESQQTGLGSQFIENFYAAIEVLPSAPFLYQIQFDNVRKYLLNALPTQLTIALNRTMC